MIFHENRLLADDSHVISCLIFIENWERSSQNLSSAAVVIGALRVITYLLFDAKLWEKWVWAYFVLRFDVADPAEWRGCQATVWGSSMCLLSWPTSLMHTASQFSHMLSTWPGSTVCNMSGNRCQFDCRPRGGEFDHGPVPYFRGDWSWINFYGHSPSFRRIILEGLLSVTSESMCTRHGVNYCRK